jgi:Ca-activated chloride channel homolog
MQENYNEDTISTMVLRIDGENASGLGAVEFHSPVDSGGLRIPMFTVLFGDADAAEPEDVAEHTGGRVFEARDGDLSGVFKETRG